ncbi:hypothetical protein CGRA01v4_09843 [Colletotrichum graminicola]|uniref:GPI anchored cell wall protein n=1 Tax=Colletotrichum graminicola (strain M1.001 / M2 / FGSC 10212) TaxID=645133 RepID=E3QXQ6_COLGM|nr:uncharacterized protein GLRG_10803 [Colletotrichum graminicola M1.001]EFQ35659.1 hypothetical protein GLRG_10803 [Colletotrichum graminicola M1.001]WDK18558.1 hypothetical protein CGRA01v4_09843 [Colletotrichum graminicola]
MKSTIILAVASGITFGVAAVNEDVIRVDNINTIEPALELTTILEGPGALVPTSVGGNGVTVIQSTVCRPVTTETCEVMDFTSTFPVSKATSAVSSEVTTTSITEQVTSKTSEAATTSGTKVTQSLESTGTVQTPSASAAANMESDASCFWAGIALLIFV